MKDNGEEKEIKYILRIVFNCDLKPDNAELLADGRYIYEEEFYDFPNLQDTIYMFYQKNCVRIDRLHRKEELGLLYEYISIDKVESIKVYGVEKR